MLVRNLTPFPWGRLLASRKPPVPEMAVVVRGTFDIVPDGSCVVTQGDPAIQGFVLGETLAESDDPFTAAPLGPNDLVPFKLNAEVLVVGNATAPGGKPVTEMPVEVRLGSWSKGLGVVGRRAYSDRGAGGLASKPHPFTSMPLHYGVAYGGPGYAPNPAGSGIESDEAPNLERAGERLASRGQRPQLGPIALGPVNIRWAARSSLLGKRYDGSWRKQRAPFFAEDFDWRYFHEAPPDQQIEGYLRGDEAFTLTNLHPTHPTVKGRLPGIRPRFFVRFATGALRDVPLALDTLTVVADLGRIVLSWRGLVEVTDDELEDVAAVVIATETLTERRPEAFFVEELDKAAASAIPAVPPDLQAKRDEAIARLERIDAAGAKARSGEATPAEAFADQIAAVLPQNDPRAADVRAQVAGALAEHDKYVPADKNRLAEVVAPPPAEPSPPPIRDLVPGEAPKLAPNRKLAKGIDDAIAQAKAVEPELERDPRGRAAEDARKVFSNLEALKVDPRFGPVFKSRVEIGPGRDLSDQDLEGEDLRGANLEGANLEGTILTRANLTGANLRGARLVSAVLFRAVLDGANLEGALLRLANFTEASGEGVVMRGVLLDRTFFEAARLPGASFVGARGLGGFFDRTALDRADFDRIDIERTRFDGASLDGATFRGAKLHRVAFDRCSLVGASFEGARVVASSFIACNAASSVFARADGRDTSFQGSVLDGADFELAVLPGVVMPRASLVAASFYGADLRGAKMARTRLDRATFERANLVDADLRKTSCAGTIFRGATLQSATLLGAAGKGADFADADLRRCHIEGWT